MHITNEIFNRLVFDYSQMIFKVAYSYTKNIADSEDIVQEVFMKLYSVHKNFESNEHVKYWLIRVTINESLDLIKRNKSATIIANEYINNVQHSSNVDNNDETLKECVLSLKDNYKTIIILYYYDGFNIKEISDILKTSEGNVKVLLNRARNMLKDKINERSNKNGK